MFFQNNRELIKAFLECEMDETVALKLAELTLADEGVVSQIVNTLLSKPVRLAIFKKAMEKENDRLCGALIADAKTAWEIYSSGCLDEVGHDFKEKLKRHFSLVLRLQPKTITAQQLQKVQEFITEY